MGRLEVNGFTTGMGFKRRERDTERKTPPKGLSHDPDRKQWGQTDRETERQGAHDMTDVYGG